MRKFLFIFSLVALLGTMATKSYAQLSDEEYNYVTMDLRGILNLTMTTNPQVDFVFKTIQEYNLGITKYNATQLEVDATLAWDLFVYASDDYWTQVEQYSTNGNPTLPAEILELQSNIANASTTENFDVFTSLKGLTNAGMPAGPVAVTTQFLTGEADLTAYGDPGTAANNAGTHKFRIDMRLKPGIPATFPNSTVSVDAAGNNETYAAAGYYYLEVVYSLVENL